jgi:ankyrin repeat protein
MQYQRRKLEMMDSYIALTEAVRTGTVEDVTKLLDSGVSPNCVRLDPDDEVFDFRNSPLVFAILAQDPDKVRSLLAAKAATHDIPDDGPNSPPFADVDNALHYLVDLWGRSSSSALKEVGELLIEYGVDINALDAGGDTALHRAVIRDHMELCKFLLKHGADPTVSSGGPKPTTPIEVAVDLGRFEILRELHLVCSTSKVEMTRFFNPLHRVAELGQWNSRLPRLLDLNVDINARDIYGYGPLKYLKTSGDSYLKGWYAFIAAGAQPTSLMLEEHGTRSLIGKALRTDRVRSAAMCGNVEMVDSVLSTLSKAASKEEIEIVESAVDLSDGASQHHFRTWLSAQLANATLVEIQTFRDLPLPPDAPSSEAMPAG